MSSPQRCAAGHFQPFRLHQGINSGLPNHPASSGRDLPATNRSKLVTSPSSPCHNPCSRPTVRTSRFSDYNDRSKLEHFQNPTAAYFVTTMGNCHLGLSTKAFVEGKQWQRTSPCLKGHWKCLSVELWGADRHSRPVAWQSLFYLGGWVLTLLLPRSLLI